MIQSCSIIVKVQLVLRDRTCQSKGAFHRASIADNRTVCNSFAQNIFVPILYRYPAFDALDDFRDFLESITCEASKTCQVRGSNPCRGATLLSFKNCRSREWRGSGLWLVHVTELPIHCQQS